MTDLSATKKPLHFVQLDTLRFLAAFMIILLHAFSSWTGWFGKYWRLTKPGGQEWTWFGRHLETFMKNMEFGVDVFFLISGFLITYLLLREKSEAGKINIPGFFMRRILRIWPLYFFVIAITPLLVNWIGAPKPEYAPVAFFYANYDIIHHAKLGLEPWQFPFSHFWSICIEEHFYLVWPFLVTFIPTKKLPTALVAVIGISIAFRAYAYCFLPGYYSWYHLYLNTFSRIDALAIGGLVAWFYFKKPFEFKVPALVRILVYVILIWSLCVDDLSDLTYIFSAIWKKYIYLLLAGFAMMNYLFNPDAKLKLGPKNPINYLGRCSYGIYIWGNIVLPIAIQLIFRPYIPHPSGFVYWSIVLGISLIVPVITYELIEKPFLKLKSRFAVIKTRV